MDLYNLVFSKSGSHKPGDYVPLTGDGFEMKHNGEIDVMSSHGDDSYAEVYIDGVSGDPYLSIEVGSGDNAHFISVETNGCYVDDNKIVTEPDIQYWSGNAGAFTLKDNWFYRLGSRGSEPANFTFAYPEGDFHCGILLTFDEGASITFPTETKFINGAPQFEAGDTWELDIVGRVDVVRHVRTVIVAAGRAE